MDKLQTQFAGLRHKTLGEKEPRDSARAARNCDFHREKLEPRPGREPYVGQDRADAYNVRLAAGGLRLDGDTTWCHVIPDDGDGLYSFLISVVWRYDDRIEDWPASYRGTLLHAYDPSTSHVEHFELAIVQGSPYTIEASTRIASTWRTVSLNLPSLSHGDVVRFVVYIKRDDPSSGDTTIWLRYYTNGGTSATTNSLTRTTESHDGLPVNYRWSIGARAWHEPDDKENLQDREIEGAVADFLVWSSETGSSLDTMFGATDWLWETWLDSEYDDPPIHHITFDRIGGWVMTDTGSAAGDAFLLPLPVLEADESTDRFEFHSGNYGSVQLPVTRDVVAEGRIVAACDFVVPKGEAPGTTPGTFIGVILAMESWRAVLTYITGPYYRVAIQYLAPSASGTGFGYTYAPASGTLAVGESVRFAVAIDRAGSANSLVFWIYSASLGSYQTGNVGVPAIVTSGGDPIYDDRKIFFGGYPVAGQLSGAFTMIEKMAIGITAQDPGNANFGTQCVDELLDTNPTAPILGQWFANAAGDDVRPGLDNTALSGVWANSRRSVLEVRDRMGHELLLNCEPKEPAFSTAMPYLHPLHPHKILGVAPYENGAGDWQLALMTEGSIEVWDGTSLSRPLEATAHDIYDTVPVQSKSFRRRTWFFGGTGIRQKFDGESSSAIGLATPFLEDLTADEETGKGGVDNGDAGIEWFRVALYNSRTGQRSNLSNPMGYDVTGSGVGLLLTATIGYRGGDDFDHIEFWRLDVSDGEYKLEMRAHRPERRGRRSANYVDFANLTGLSLPDNRVPIRLSQAQLAHLEMEEADNHTPPLSLIGEFHADRLYLVPRDEPETVIYSKPHLVESFPANNFAKIGERAADQIRGLASTSIGLLVMTRRETWVIARGTEENPTPERLSRESGCLSPTTIAQSDDGLFWLSERGVEGFFGNRIQLVSDGIQDVINDLSYSDLVTAHAGVWRRRQQYWLVVGSSLFILDLSNGTWKNGEIGASWLGDGAFVEGGKEELYSGWYGRLYQHVEERREDGVSWGASSLVDEEEVTNSDWLTSGATVIGFDNITSSVASAVVPASAFIAFDSKLINGGLPIPVTIDRIVGTKAYFAEAISYGSSTKFYMYWYVPLFYETNRIIVEGPHVQKRLRNARLHYDPASDSSAACDLSFLTDDTVTHTTQNVVRGTASYGRLGDQKVDYTLHRRCRNFAMRMAAYKSTWPAFGFLEWFYQLMRAPR